MSNASGKKALLTAACAVLLLASFFLLPRLLVGDPDDDSGYLNRHVSSQIDRALVVFGIAKGVNAVISVVQSMHFEASAVVFSFGVSPFELLDPVNDLIESISDWLLIALGALVLQKLLLYVNGWIVFKALIPVGLACLAGSLWGGGAAAARFRAAGLKCLVLAGVVGVFLPASIQLSVCIEHGILAKTLDASLSSLERDSQSVDVIGGELASLQGEATGTPEASGPSVAPEPGAGDGEASGSWLGRQVDKVRRLGSALSVDALKQRIGEMTNRLKERANDMALSFLKLLTVFALNTVLLPLATLWALWQVLRWILNRPFDPRAFPRPAGRSRGPSRPPAPGQGEPTA
ncbi:MAG: hypothetical protein AB7D57_03270 [Desulfovibrionaceae bacterium]